MIKHQERHYLELIKKTHLTGFQVRVKETDLFIQANKSLKDVARELIFTYRNHIENYITQHPGFMESLVPWSDPFPTPPIINDMIMAGNEVRVGNFKRQVQLPRAVRRLAHKKARISGGKLYNEFGAEQVG